MPTGRYEVSLEELRTPPKKMRSRDLSRARVDDIKRNLLLHPTKSLTVMAAVVDIEEPADRIRGHFKPGEHQLWTLGGNHARTAIKELLAEKRFEAENNQVSLISTNCE